MTDTPIRSGIATIDGKDYPAMVGEVAGDEREIFVCGLHIDRFLGTLPPASCLRIARQGVQIRVET